MAFGRHDPVSVRILPNFELNRDILSETFLVVSLYMHIVLVYANHKAMLNKLLVVL